MLLLSISTNGIATKYFVNCYTGDDNNSGLSESLPWQSVNRVNIEALVGGDSVFFIGDGVWREQIIPKSGNSSNHIYYGAYNLGNKPLFLGSINKSHTSDWFEIAQNIWQSTDTVPTDIGNIIFNDELSVGVKKWRQSDLKTQDDFYFNIANNHVFIHSIGNPASTHSSIELALNKPLVDSNVKNFFVIENLSFKYGGADAIRLSNCTNINLRSLDISYCGGGRVNLANPLDTVRFGNGVQIWLGADRIKVEKCKIWEMYDVGLTNQSQSDWNGGATPSNQSNIEYRNNIIWNCPMASFEIWNRPALAKLNNIYFENNTCLNAGYGWSANQRPDRRGHHLLIGDNEGITDSIFIRNNIFYRSSLSSIFVEYPPSGWDKIVMDYNCIYEDSPIDTAVVIYQGASNITVVPYSQLNSYSSITGKETHSIFINPEMFNPLGININLMSNSPCINKGINCNTTNDFEGEIRILGQMDIGADEFTISTNLHETNSNLNIVPNPIKNSFTLICNNNSTEQIYVYDINGKCIYRNEATGKTELNSTNWKKGIYILKRGNNYKKIIKE